MDIEYEIRVAGTVDPATIAELSSAHFQVQEAETVLRGPVPDQAALLGIINWLQTLGIELREVRQAPDADR